MFFSICQTPVDGYTPNEKQMFTHFFDQVKLADELGYTTAWVAETHLSCQVQKQNPDAVIPDFKGEIGLNTDILQLAHKIFSMTKRIHVGSAIRNIFCNGGPLAHAEAIRTFMSLHSLDENEKRLLNIGFASGRFPFSNVPYGIKPRNDWEKAAWPILKGKIFHNAIEIFLKALRGDIFSSDEVTPILLCAEDFPDKNKELWQTVCKNYLSHHPNSQENNLKKLPVDPFWSFPKVGVIPFESSLELLRLTIGSQEPFAQELANRFYPVGVFNLSITPGPVVEQTHKRMIKHYHHDGGSWNRSYMPRTTLVFIDDKSPDRANQMAVKALENYWKALEGTLNPSKIENAVNNALVGTPEQVAAQIKERFDPEDRLMLWFDFNNHNNDEVKNMMTLFYEKVIPLVG